MFLIKIEIDFSTYYFAREKGEDDDVPSHNSSVLFHKLAA